MSLYQCEKEGVIYVWDTGRHYDSRGQIIAAVKIPYEHRIIFWDSSRHIDGMFPAMRGNTKSQVLAAYDNGCYEAVSAGNRPIEKQLGEAAKDWVPGNTLEIPLESESLSCKYCGGNCPNDPEGEHLRDGFAGDIDGLYEEEDARG